MFHLLPWQWFIICIGAAGIGLSKTGIAGLGIVAVAVFAVVLPARESVGVVLPILLCGDIIAVSAYRRHAVWKHLWLLFPWAAVGLVIGYFAMGHVNDQQMAQLIGGILLLLVALQLWRRKFRGMPTTGADLADAEDPAPTSLALAIFLGVLGGFATMVANAAGPIMIMYFLAMRLPKLEFVGTAAWYFLVLNLVKVPLQYHLGLINSSSLPMDLVLAPFVVAGALAGRALLPKINQAVFENVAWAFTVVAGMKLLI